MKLLVIVFGLLLFVSCQEERTVKKNEVFPDNSSVVTIQLIDSLGSITCSVPNRYDTFFQWTNWSDCGKGCAKEEYRFQPKNLIVSKETGFFYTGEPKDSIERFTVLHSGYFPFHEVSDSSIFLAHRMERLSLSADPRTYQIRSDTVEKIGDRLFSIFIIDLTDTLKIQSSKQVIGSTLIHGNGITFKYELLTKQKDSISANFIKNSKQLLHTIRVGNRI